MTMIFFESALDINALKHIKFEKSEDKHFATLINNNCIVLAKGFGDTKAKALNNLHANLINKKSMII